MESTIIVALITNVCTLAGAYIASRQQAREIDHKLDKQQAILNTKIDELTREVREHNDFTKRIPVVEEQMRVANHRISDLEGYHKHA